MNIVGMIPARMGSSRFPGKPLAQICGISMIEHVYKRCLLSKSLSDVYIATCDEEIVKATNDFGGKAVMTKNTHERASDRVAEAMLKAEKDTGKRIDILVMIQGDEPMVYPEMIDESVKPLLADPDRVQVANLLAPIGSAEEHEDPNAIKVVVDPNYDALYFSRAPIPSRARLNEKTPMYKQVCIIPFLRDFLLEFNRLPQTPLEIAESVDMMRVLEHGRRVRMVLTAFQTFSVDTLEDLKKVEMLMLEDALYKRYGKKGAGA